MEVSCKQLTRDSLPASGLGRGLISPHHKKSTHCETIHRVSEWILWNNLSNGNWTSDLEFGRQGVYTGQVH
jgi:hypothetical protein